MTIITYDKLCVCSVEMCGLLLFILLILYSHLRRTPRVSNQLNKQPRRRREEEEERPRRRSGQRERSVNVNLSNCRGLVESSEIDLGSILWCVAQWCKG